MIYFSEIKNKRVYTEDGLLIGTLDDAVFTLTETPQIVKIVVKPLKQISQEALYIPHQYLLRMSPTVAVSKNYETTILAENELFVFKNLVDKQIIDMSGQKVVRVNDVVIQQKNGNFFFIGGVDIGLVGILRRFGADKIIEKVSAFFGKGLTSTIIPWSNIQPLELTRGKVVLNIKQEKLQKLHPADLADYLEATNVRNIVKIIDLLDKEFAAKVIAELNLNYQISLLKKLAFEKTVKILSLIDPDEAVDILTQFSSKRREGVLKSLPRDRRSEIEHLLKLEDTVVGQYLTTEVLTVKSSDTAAKVIEVIRKETRDMSFLPYVYVVNGQNQLHGVLSLHDLLLQTVETPIYKFMIQNVIVIHLHTSLYSVFRKLIKYKLAALPVVDVNKKIIGMITMDDIGENFLSKI
ncbi:MAG TPA: CBS domain-containing protein [Patescibacteria group bacterium]|nr:CBS domain-containing protein [Patescibacteria group bacterium]